MKIRKKERKDELEEYGEPIDNFKISWNIENFSIPRQKDYGSTC